MSNQDTERAARLAAADLLEAHNEWRRDTDNTGKARPAALGLAIDTAVQCLRATAPEVAQAEPVAYRYKDARGHWRYVGAPFTPGWSMPPSLSHEPLFAGPALRQEPAAPSAINTALAALSANHQWHCDHDDDSNYVDGGLEAETKAAIRALQQLTSRAAPQDDSKAPAADKSQLTKEQADGRHDELRPALHGGMAVGGDATCAMASGELSSLTDRLWHSDAVMRLNADLGLTMEQLAPLAAAILAAAPTRSHEAACQGETPPLTDAMDALVNFKTAKQQGIVAGDGKPCPNDHDPDCRWPQCICRNWEITRAQQAVEPQR